MLTQKGNWMVLFWWTVSRVLSFCKSYLVDLPIGAVSNQFDQLKDPSRVLKQRGRAERQQPGQLNGGRTREGTSERSWPSHTNTALLKRRWSVSLKSFLSFPVVLQEGNSSTHSQSQNWTFCRLVNMFHEEETNKHLDEVR